ncbi:endolytic transglycosylase MltG [Streptomyces sp. NPDC048664]|uniref:endolytic transglycosylase MltG n=1 Tax=Streptomyces sp. NPDC048664 TaxID=3154505 RepID=UPI00343BF1EA
MTEYGRGQGSEPWHPEDPLYGDVGYAGQRPGGAQSPYGGAQPPHYPQQPQQHHGDWGGPHAQQGAYGQGQQGYQQYPQQGQPYPQQGQPQQGQPYPQQGQPQQGQPQYGGQQYPQGGQPYPGQQSYPGQEQYPGQHPQPGYEDAAWGGGQAGQQGRVPYPADPYAAQGGAYGAEQSAPHPGPPEEHPPSPPPNGRRAEAEPEPDWDPGPDRGEHAFFAGGGGDDGDDDGDDEPQDGRGDRRGRGGKGKKRRGGCAGLAIALVVVGGLGGAGYLGYRYYENRFGTAPDYAGTGSAEQITVTIPGGSTGAGIGRVLKQAGVVKSVDAFVAAQEQNPDGKTIQAGTYTLHKQMSAASAVELMLSPKSKNNLIIAEGWRNAKVYEAIDGRLQLKPGTTKDIAHQEWKSFGLPDWADTDKNVKDPLEGFLYPSSYPVAKGMKPEAVLKQMVATAKQKYGEYGIETKAQSLNLKNPLQVLTVASLVQAEGKYKHDFEKVSTVVYNRLKPNNTETNGRLDFDSTVNYMRGESKLATGSVDELRRLDDPYNTYRIQGLPPGPIDNPGEVAIKAALAPAKGNWYYFVSINENETLFAETNAEQNRNREKYLEEQKKGQ